MIISIRKKCENGSSDPGKKDTRHNHGAKVPIAGGTVQAMPDIIGIWDGYISEQKNVVLKSRKTKEIFFENVETQIQIL